MLDRGHKIALYMEDSLGKQEGKMGSGVLRYSPNEIACVIDSTQAVRPKSEQPTMPRECPIVSTIDEAHALGATVLVLGIAPPGGQIPPAWYVHIDRAVQLGMSLVNGLHEQLNLRYPSLSASQWVWDIRQEPKGLLPGRGLAGELSNRRLLMIGTDMSIGKMTAGLEIWRSAKEMGVNAEFVATGQIGITVTGRGVPLDAVRLDYACGAIEREVMDAKDAELIVVEGQGSLVHPGSTANLPLIRGSIPTHFVMCHRAGQESLYRIPAVKIPPLNRLIGLYEDLSECAGVYPRAKTAGVCLNTAHLASDSEALNACRRIEDELGIPCVDPIRHGPERIVDAVLA